MLPYIPFEWEVCAVIRMKHSAKNIIGIVIFSVALTNEDIFQGRLEKKKKQILCNPFLCTGIFSYLEVIIGVHSPRQVKEKNLEIKKIFPRRRISNHLFLNSLCFVFKIRFYL